MKRVFSQTSTTTTTSSSSSSGSFSVLKLPPYLQGHTAVQSSAPAAASDKEPLRRLYPSLLPFSLLEDDAGLPVVLIQLILDYWLGFKDFYGTVACSVSTLVEADHKSLVLNEPWRQVLMTFDAGPSLWAQLASFDGTLLPLDHASPVFKLAYDKNGQVCDYNPMRASETNRVRVECIRFLYGPHVVSYELVCLNDHRGSVMCTVICTPTKRIQKPNNEPLQVCEQGVWTNHYDHMLCLYDWQGADLVVLRWYGRASTMTLYQMAVFPMAHVTNAVATVPTTPTYGPKRWSHGREAQLELVEKRWGGQEDQDVHMYQTDCSARLFDFNGKDTLYLDACDGFCGSLWQGNHPLVLDGDEPVPAKCMAYCKGLLFVATRGQLVIFQ